MRSARRPAKSGWGSIFHGAAQDLDIAPRLRRSADWPARRSPGVGQPTASHLVDRLVQNGLVVRTEDPLDRRRTLAELSPEGIELIERLRQVRLEALQRWLVQLDDTALAALHLGFRALADVAEAERTLISESSYNSPVLSRV